MFLHPAMLPAWAWIGPALGLAWAWLGSGSGLASVWLGPVFGLATAPPTLRPSFSGLLYAYAGSSAGEAPRNKFKYRSFFSTGRGISFSGPFSPASKRLCAREAFIIASTVNRVLIWEVAAVWRREDGVRRWRSLFLFMKPSSSPRAYA